MFKVGDLVRVRDPHDEYAPVWAEHGYLWLVEEMEDWRTQSSLPILSVKSLATGYQTRIFPRRFEGVPSDE